MAGRGEFWCVGSSVVSPLSSSTPLDERWLRPDVPPENFTRFVDFCDREKSVFPKKAVKFTFIALINNTETLKSWWNRSSDWFFHIVMHVKKSWAETWFYLPNVDWMLRCGRGSQKWRRIWAFSRYFFKSELVSYLFIAHSSWIACDVVSHSLHFFPVFFPEFPSVVGFLRRDSLVDRLVFVSHLNKLLPPFLSVQTVKHVIDIEF